MIFLILTLLFIWFPKETLGILRPILIYISVGGFIIWLLGELGINNMYIAAATVSVAVIFALWKTL